MNLSIVCKKFRFVFNSSREITDAIFTDFIQYAWGGNTDRARELFAALRAMGYLPALFLERRALKDGIHGYKKEAASSSSSSNE